MVGLFIAVVLFYGYKSLFKYLDGKILRAQFQEYEGERVFYPSITICSGFRDSHWKFKDALEEMINRNGTLDEDDESWMVELLHNLTYPKEEYLSYFTQGVENVWDTNYLFMDDLWTESLDPFYGGRCATARLPNASLPGLRRLFVL